MAEKFLFPKVESATLFSGVGFGSTEYVIIPVPVPLSPSIICNQSDPLAAVHSQLGCVTTFTVATPPSGLNFFLLGDSLYVQVLIVSSSEKSLSCSCLIIGSYCKIIVVSLCKLTYFF